MSQAYRALISAPSKKQAHSLLAALTQKRLVAGGLITVGEALYWWKGKRVKKQYANLSVFTVGRHRKAVLRLVEKRQSDEVPIVAFFKIDDANESFLKWIKLNVEGS